MGCCLGFTTTFLGITVLLVVLKLYIKLTTGWCRSYTCLVGKTAIVTGANTGLGFETALDLAKRGARVILACRNEEKAEIAKEKIIYYTGNDNIVIKILDTASLDSVRKFAADVNKSEERLDILVNNAGASGLSDAKTEDGVLLGLHTNYFGPFLLTILLLGLLKRTGNSRIVNVASLAAKGVHFTIDTINDYPSTFNPGFKLYKRTKLCNILFTIELAKKLSKTTVTTYSLHPGVIFTEIIRNMSYYAQKVLKILGYLFLKDVMEGAQTQIYLAVAKDIEKFNGEHFHDCKRVEKYKSATVDGLGKELWEYSVKVVKLTKEEMKNLD